MAEAPLILVTSPSQYKTFEELCPRKWWLRYERDCVEPERSFQGYGKVTHAVIERFLKAPANGRDPETGQPVEYFPEGWDRDPRLGTVLPAEADQIRRLFWQAVEDGVLVRPAGVVGDDFLVEHRYVRALRDRVHEHGVIDLMTAAGITDHKTTSKRRWALTEEKLARDAQMRSYGNVRRQVVREGGCELQHNIFVKDGAGYAFKRHVVVTAENLDEREAQTQETVDQMIALQGVGDLAWESVPGPREGSDACNAYGGCPYRGICSGSESINAYRLRMKRAADYKKERESMSAEGAPSAPAAQRSLASRFQKRGAIPASQTSHAEGEMKAPVVNGQQGVVPPPPAVPHAEVAPINPPAPAEPAAATPAPGGDFLAAPWFTPGCVACKSPFPGFSSTLQPCRVCEMRQKRAAPPGPIPAEYDWGVELGKPWWRPKGRAGTVVVGASDPVVAALQDKAAENRAADVDQEFKDRAGAAPVQDSKQDAPSAAATAAPAAAPPTPARKRGRPRKASPPGADAAAAAILAGGDVDEEAGKLSYTFEEVKELMAEAVTFVRDEAAAAIKKLGEEPTVSAELDGGGDPALVAALTEARGRIAILEQELRHLAEMPEAQSFQLYVDCKPASFGQPIVDFATVVQDAGAELAKQQGVSSYWELNAFQRRDMLCQLAPQIAAQLAGKCIVARNPSGIPDAQQLLEALRPFAKLVIEH